MQRFYIYGTLDLPTGLLRDAHTEVPKLPAYSYFDARLNDFVSSPERGRSIVFRDADLTPIEAADVPGVQRKLRKRLLLAPL